MNAIAKKIEALKAAAKAHQETIILAKLENEEYQKKFIMQHMRDQTFNKLQEMETTFRSIVEMNPVQRADGANKVWRNRYIYGIGDEVRVLLNLLSGFRYAAAEHKELMKVELPVSEVLAGEVLDALGTFTYFNTTYSAIVPGQIGNAKKLAELLDVVATQMSITIDTSQVTQANFEKLENKARLLAEADQAKWEEAVEHTRAHGVNFTM